MTRRTVITLPTVALGVFGFILLIVAPRVFGKWELLFLTMFVGFALGRAVSIDRHNADAEDRKRRTRGKP